MSEAGARLGRDRKKKLISLYAPAAESYSRLEGRHTVFDCENGFRLDALWSKHTRIRALLRGREYGVRRNGFRHEWCALCISHIVP